jgi:hypothetical protein
LFSAASTENFKIFFAAVEEFMFNQIENEENNHHRVEMHVEEKQRNFKFNTKCQQEESRKKLQRG